MRRMRRKPRQLKSQRKKRETGLRSQMDDLTMNSVFILRYGGLDGAFTTPWRNVGRRRSNLSWARIKQLQEMTPVFLENHQKLACGWGVFIRHQSGRGLAALAIVRD